MNGRRMKNNRIKISLKALPPRIVFISKFFKFPDFYTFVAAKVAGPVFRTALKWESGANPEQSPLL